MRGGAALALALGLIAGVGLADAPATSIRPVQRPVVQGAAAPAEPAIQAAPTAPKPPAPKPRPDSLAAPEPAVVAEPEPAAAVVSAFPGGVIRPRPRPAEVIQTAANTSPTSKTPAPKPKASAKGAVCGDPAIKGQMISPVTSRVNGCGVAEPVKITSVSGVVLNPAATVDCATAQALRKWVDQGLQPAFAPGEVVELRIFGSYICRSRNNVRGAKISEHGHGKAVDIGAFVLSSGKTVTVASNYNAQVRRAYKAACGIFGTTLGPGSDGYHEDHLHFDTASYRSGSYCR